MTILSFFLLLSLSFSAWASPNQEKIKRFFDNLRASNLSLVDEFYDPQIVFIDPVDKLTGIAKVKTYYQKMYEDVKNIKFDFSKFIESENNVVAEWKMILEADGLNGGEPVIVEGNSVFLFGPSGKAIYHRDYFDMGAFIYEHVPMLGFIVKKIKKKMQLDEKN